MKIVKTQQRIKRRLAAKANRSLMCRRVATQLGADLMSLMMQPMHVARGSKAELRRARIANLDRSDPAVQKLMEDDFFKPPHLQHEW